MGGAYSRWGRPKDSDSVLRAPFFQGQYEPSCAHPRRGPIVQYNRRLQVLPERLKIPAHAHQKMGRRPGRRRFRYFLASEGQEGDQSRREGKAKDTSLPVK
jgi:hypothetical protein